MNALTYALNQVRFQIPNEILNLAFSDNINGPANTMVSLDERILANVIRPRVLVDCNLVGGEFAYIQVSSGIIKYFGRDGFVVNFPKNVTKNKTIISATSVMSAKYMLPYEAYATNSHTDIIAEAATMARNISSHFIQASSSLEMMGENTVYVHEYFSSPETLTMRVMLENDLNLGNINARSYPSFSELVIYAVKAYIRNRLLITIDVGYIHAGHELSIIKELIDEYQSAEETYREFLTTTWARVAYMNDGQLFDGYVLNLFSNNF